MKTVRDDDLKGGRDAFFQHLKLLWWPETRENSGFPSPERQLELFRRICISWRDECWLKCSLEQFNSILTECNQTTVNSSFFNYFFPGFSTKMRLGDFMNGVMKFLKIALWKYGDFSQALRELGRSSNVQSDICDVPLRGVSSIPESIFTTRTPLDFIQSLPSEERLLLAYTTQPADTDAGSLERAKTIGKQNAREYLALGFLDIYVATSMRELEEFRSFETFMKQVFEHPDLARLNLRYFDPTIVYCDNRVAKGLLEALMLRLAKLTLYVAGEKDTFGKDSECAATLTQGKPVIVYVEEVSDKRKEKFDERARLFRDIHPLGLQACYQTGVANGVIVVRTIQDCRKVLKDFLLHNLDLYLDKDTTGYLLKERTTQSIVRVAPGDPLLVRSYRNFYSKGS